MRQTRPLPEKYPEFTVHDWPGFTEYRVENWRLARDGSGRVVRGTCVWSWVDVVVLALVAAVVSVCWGDKQSSALFIPISRPVLVVAIAIVVLSRVWARCTQVLYESVLVFPTLGIQLETHRGHSFLPSPFHTISRHFIPLDALEDLVIHEGFRRWNVRFYLAVLHRRGGVRLARGDGLLSTSMVMDDVTSTVTASPDPHATSYPETETEADNVPLCPTSGTIRVVVAFENILPYFPVLRTVYLGVQETLFPPPTRVVDMDGSVDSGSAPKG